MVYSSKKARKDLNSGEFIAVAFNANNAVLSYYFSQVLDVGSQSRIARFFIKTLQMLIYHFVGYLLVCVL